MIYYYLLSLVISGVVALFLHNGFRKLSILNGVVVKLTDNTEGVEELIKVENGEEFSRTISHLSYLRRGYKVVKENGEYRITDGYVWEVWGIPLLIALPALIVIFVYEFGFLN